MTREVKKDENIDVRERLGQIEKKIDLISLNSIVFGSGVAGHSADFEIDLRQLWRIVWCGKWLILGIVLSFSVASVFYSLSLPNVYKSETLLAPVEEDSGSGLASLSGKIGGLASLAGVSLSGGGTDKTALAIEILKSKEFVARFIANHDLLVPLMAAEGWNRKNNTLIIDADLYDTKKGAWVRDVSSPFEPKPSMLEAHREFKKYLNISEGKDSNFVSISFEFYSPHVAKEWVSWLVKDINEAVKSRDVAQAQRSIEYLSAQLEKTSIADMQSIFYELIEEQTKTIMFAEVREEYVFKTIDPPFSPERKIRPRRGLICVLGALLGGMVGVVVVMIGHYSRRQ